MHVKYIVVICFVSWNWVRVEFAVPNYTLPLTKPGLVRISNGYTAGALVETLTSWTIGHCHSALFPVTLQVTFSAWESSTRKLLDIALVIYGLSCK